MANKNTEIREMFATLNDELNHYKTKYLAAADGCRSAQRGISRLKRKIEMRDRYVTAVENYFFTEGGHTPLGLAALTNARTQLGILKKPKPENVP